MKEMQAACQKFRDHVQGNLNRNRLIATLIWAQQFSKEQKKKQETVSAEQICNLFPNTNTNFGKRDIKTKKQVYQTVIEPIITEAKVAPGYNS